MRASSNHLSAPSRTVTCTFEPLEYRRSLSANGIAQVVSGNSVIMHSQDATSHISAPLTFFRANPLLVASFNLPVCRVSRGMELGLRLHKPPQWTTVGD